MNKLYKKIEERRFFAHPLWKMLLAIVIGAFLAIKLLFITLSSRIDR